MSKKILSLALAVVMLALASSLLLLPADAAQVTPAKKSSIAWQEAHFATYGYWAGNAGNNQGVPQVVFTDDTGILNSNTGLKQGVKYLSQFTVGALNATTKEFVVFDSWVNGTDYLTSSRWLDQYGNLPSGWSSTVPTVENRWGWMIPCPVSGWHIAFRYTATRSGNVGMLIDDMIGDCTTESRVNENNVSAMCLLKNGELWSFTPSQYEGTFDWSTFSYTDTATWPVVDDIDAENTSVTGNMYVNLATGDTFDWVTAYVSGTNHCAFRNPNLQTWPSDGNYNNLRGEYSSPSSVGVYDINNWGPRYGYQSAFDGSMIETLDEYKSDILMAAPITYAENGWKVGSLTTTGFSPMTNVYYHTGSSIEFTSTGTFVQEASSINKLWIVSQAYYDEMMTAYVTFDESADTLITEGANAGNYLSSSGEAWNNPGGIQYNGDGASRTAYHVSQNNTNNAFAYQYTAKNAGVAKLSLNKLWFDTATLGGFNTYFAVAINGTVVWPEGAALDGARSAWYKINSAADKDALNTALGAKMFSVAAGDKIEFCFSHEILNWGVACNAGAATVNVDVDPMVQIESGNTVETHDKVYLTQSDKFVLTYYVKTNGVAGIAGLKDQDGNFYPGTFESRNDSDKMNNFYKVQVPVAAKDAAATLTLTPYYAFTTATEDIDYFLAASAYADVSIAGLLDSLTCDANQKVADTAGQMLNYIAAAQAYFGIGGTPANEATADDFPVTVTGDYSAHGLDGLNCTGTETVAMRGITLTLEDQLNIKLIVSGANLTGKKLVVATDDEFTQNLQEIALKEVAGFANYREAYIPVGPGNFATDYYMYVADANGDVVSDLIIYSVAAYYEANKGTSDANLKALLDAMMCLYETVVA